MTSTAESSTSVDVLIARLETHPEEFFVKEAVASYDGEKIFARTKWRRITVTLMLDAKPGEANLWMNLFSGEEKDRFRTAMYAALRKELDAQILTALVSGVALPRTAEEQKVWEEAQMQQRIAQMNTQQMRAQAMRQWQNAGLSQLGGTVSQQQNALQSIGDAYHDLYEAARRKLGK